MDRPSDLINGLASLATVLPSITAAEVLALNQPAAAFATDRSGAAGAALNRAPITSSIASGFRDAQVARTVSYEAVHSL